MGTRGQIGRCSKCTEMYQSRTPRGQTHQILALVHELLTMKIVLQFRNIYLIDQLLGFERVIIIRVPKFQKNANCDWGVAKFAIVDFVKNINGLRCRSRNFPSAILGWIRDYWKLGIEKIRHQNRKSKFINVARWSEMWLYCHPAGWNL